MQDKILSSNLQDSSAVIVKSEGLRESVLFCVIKYFLLSALTVDSFSSITFLLQCKVTEGQRTKISAKKLLKHPPGFIVMLYNVILTPNTCWKHNGHYKLLWKQCGQADKIILSDNYSSMYKWGFQTTFFVFFQSF